MASKSQVLLNPQVLFEDHHHHHQDQDQDEAAANSSSQMGFFSTFFPSNLTFLQAPSPSPPFEPPNFCSSETLLSSSSSSLLMPPKQRDHHDCPSSQFVAHHLLSLQTSNANLWPWGEVGESLMSGKRVNGGNGNEYHHNHHHLGVSAMKMKKMKGRRKVREPRFSFKTMSDVDVLDDGYKWRKYGQKVVKNTHHPRSYYRCTQDHCRVKKRVERLAEDPRMVITTYEGRHVHSPSHDSEDSEAQTHLNNFFW